MTVIGGNDIRGEMRNMQGRGNEMEVTGKNRTGEGEMMQGKEGKIWREALDHIE